MDTSLDKAGRENNAALLYNYRHVWSRREAHLAGSSVMRLWLTSKTSSFFASHSQSGKDSMWFLEGGRGSDDDELCVAFKLCYLKWNIIW